MLEKGWEHFSHQADIGIRGIGLSKQEAFEQAATALTAVITNPHNVAAKKPLQISCEAPDDELLLVDWLNALIYEMATRKMLFGRFQVTIHGERLRAEIWGEKIDVARHQPAVEVKGATFTELKVRQDPTGTWIAQCVVDV
ncbi:MAG: archease [Deltaproteobacteria bacterium]|nr:archease [Deltaproteobacteria bacterium]